MGTATTWMAVAAGGALGSLARYLLGAVISAVTGPRFPWGTLLINVAGSFVLIWLYLLQVRKELLGSPFRSPFARD